MTAILNASRLTVRAGTATLLNDVSLDIAAGERVALVGPNGAGKSTLLRTLSGDLRPSRGTVHLLGRDVAAYDPRELAQRRAVLAQHVTVAFPFRVAEIVAMGGRDTQVPGAVINHALEKVGLDGFADRIFTTLSGGEQQRAHVARVLVQMTVGKRDDRPGLIFLDEPTASLDLRHQLDLAGIVRGCADGGLAVVSILHDINLVPLFADRVLVLDHGRLVADGRTADTINEEMMQRVFKVFGSVGTLPAEGVPFVLPQAATESR